MVHKGVDTFRMEVGENRHSHRTVCVGGKEAYRPSRGIPGTYGNLVAFLYPGLPEKNMELLNIGGCLTESERLPFEITQCLPVPMRLDNIFQT